MLRLDAAWLDSPLVKPGECRYLLRHRNRVKMKPVALPRNAPIQERLGRTRAHLSGDEVDAEANRAAVRGRLDDQLLGPFGISWPPSIAKRAHGLGHETYPRYYAILTQHKVQIADALEEHRAAILPQMEVVRRMEGEVRISDWPQGAWV